MLRTTAAGMSNDPITETVKVIRGARARFGRVKLLKPEASRSRSPEIYLLAMQFRLV